jgi:polysaccharide biosynthesis transport protein
MAAVISADLASADSLERLRSFWRRRRTFFAIAAGGLLVTLLLALLLPPVYRSAATILIEQQEIPQDLVRSTITSYADERIQVISQRVMTTQNLLRIIDQYDLYPDRRHRDPRELLLKRMRDDIMMKTISAEVIDPRSGRPMQAVIAFSVAYSNQSPDLALKVANELTSLYLNENLSSRTRLAQQSADFLSEEADRQQKRIADLDAKLAAFKELHHDRLPELGVLNIEIMNRTELELRDVKNRLDALAQQKVLLRAQLAQINPTSQLYSDKGERVYSPEDRLKALRAQLALLNARYGPQHPDVLQTQREVAGLEEEVAAEAGTNDLSRRLMDARGQLAAASERYAPDHPDVMRLGREVRELEAEILRTPAASATERAYASADNPAYVQVKGQLDGVEVEERTAARKADELHAKLGDFERRLSDAPEVERVYRELMRDLEGAQLKYQEIRSKMTEAQVSQHLETEQKGERFTLIEPPQPPERPESPNRWLILALGTALCLALAAGGTVLQETIDGSVRGSRDLYGMLQVAPLAALPVIETRAERTARLRHNRLLWASAGGASVLFVTFVHFAIKPLDVIWAVVSRRWGL